MNENTVKKRGIGLRVGDRGKFQRARPHACGKIGQTVFQAFQYIVEAFTSTLPPAVSAKNIKMLIRGPPSSTGINSYGQTHNQLMQSNTPNQALLGNGNEGQNITFNQVTNYNVFKDAEKQQGLDYGTIFSNSMKRYRSVKPQQEPDVSSIVSTKKGANTDNHFSFENSMMQNRESNQTQKNVVDSKMMPTIQESKLGKRKNDPDSSGANSQSSSSIYEDAAKAKQKRRKVNVDFDVQQIFDSKKMEESLAKAMENRIEKTVNMIEKKLAHKMTNQFSKMWEKAIDQFQDKLRETNDLMSQRSRSNLSRCPSDQSHCSIRSNTRPRSTSPQILPNVALDKPPKKFNQRSRSNSSQDDSQSMINIIDQSKKNKLLFQEKLHALKSPEKKVDNKDKPQFGTTEKKSSKLVTSKTIESMSMSANIFSQPIPSDASKMKPQANGGSSLFGQKDDQKPKVKEAEMPAGGSFGAAKKPTNTSSISNQFGAKPPQEKKEEVQAPTTNLFAAKPSIDQNPMQPVSEVRANPFLKKDSVKNNPFLNKASEEKQLFGGGNKAPAPPQSQPNNAFSGMVAKPSVVVPPPTGGDKPSIFGQKPPTGPPSGLFGNNPPPITSSQFGGQSTRAPEPLNNTPPPAPALVRQPQGGLFGSKAPSAPGLFGSGAPPPTATGSGPGLFGGQGAPSAISASGPGLFGAKPPAQGGAMGGGLFGSKPAGQSLFSGGNPGNAPPPAPTSGMMFGGIGVQQTQGGGMFGSQQQMQGQQLPQGGGGFMMQGQSGRLQTSNLFGGGPAVKKSQAAPSRNDGLFDQ